MNSMPPSADAQGYLENLMRAGQDVMKQFDSALISSMGVSGKAPLLPGTPLFPFALPPTSSGSTSSSYGNSGTPYF